MSDNYPIMSFLLGTIISGIVFWISHEVNNEFFMAISFAFLFVMLISVFTIPKSMCKQLSLQSNLQKVKSD